MKYCNLTATYIKHCVTELSGVVVQCKSNMHVVWHWQNFQGIAHEAFEIDFVKLNQSHHLTLTHMHTHTH